MNSGDVFILVYGEDKIWLWVGSDANTDERAKGYEVAMDFYTGGGEGWYNDDAVDGKKCDNEGQEEVGKDNGGEEK